MSAFAETMREIYGAVLCGMIFVAGCFMFAIVADWIKGELP